MKKLFRSSVEVVLFLTDRCHLKCPYCFVDLNQNREIDLSDLEKFFQVLEAETEKTATIQIYLQGAEPTLFSRSKLEDLNFLLKEFKKKRPFVRVQLQTNLYSPLSRLKTFLKNVEIDSVSSSFDFARPIEPLKIKKRIKILRDEFGIDFRGFVVVLTKKTFRKEIELISKLKEIVNSKIRIRLREIVQTERNKEISLSEIETLESFLRFFQIYLKDEDVETIEPLSSILYSIIFDQENLRNCIFRNCESMFSFSPYGIATCDLFLAINHKKIRIDFDNYREFFRKIQERKRRLCLDCRYRKYCCGGCAARAFSRYNSLFEKDPYCRVFFSLFKHSEEIVKKFDLNFLIKKVSRAFENR